MQKIKSFLLSSWFKIIVVIIGVMLILIYRNYPYSGALITVAILAVYWFIQYLIRKQYKKMIIFMTIYIAMIIAIIVFLI